MTLSLKIPLPESRFGGPRAARPLQKRAARTGRRRPVPNPAISLNSRGSRPKSKLSTKAGQVHCAASGRSGGRRSYLGRSSGGRSADVQTLC